ncbi:MAG: hypothetical protein LBS74_02815 [Oscillospiraceae bacterium]|jgi:hypothetical protein|nr:hypothetical protein [Oscillospiraceae bacterium]
MKKINISILSYGIKRLLKKDFNITLVLIFQCVLSFFLLAITFNNTYAAITTNGEFKEFIGDKLYYTVQDLADEDGGFDQYMDSNAKFEDLKDFVESLEQNEQFSYVNTMLQSLYIIDTALPAKFAEGYEQGENALSIIREEDGKKLLSFKGLQVSYNVFEEFGKELETGEYFSKDDFIYDETKPIQVILGNEYKAFYNLGDIIAANDSRYDINIQVKGFLPKDSYMPVKGSIVYLDRYIVYPYYSGYSNMGDDKHLRIARFTLAGRANGEIITSDSHLNVQNLIDALSEQYNTFKFKVYSIDSSGINAISQMSEKMANQFLMLALALMFFTVFGISATVVGRIRTQSYEYGVNLISGATLSDIVVQAVGAISCLVLIALAISEFATLIVIGSFGVYLLLTPLLAIITIVISSLIPISSILKMDVNTLIRRKE